MPRNPRNESRNGGIFLVVACSLLFAGCPKPTPLQIAASASESMQRIEEHVRSIRPQEYCRHHTESEVSQRTSVQEFDEMRRLVRRVVTSSPGADSETLVEYRALDGGGLETGSLARTSLDSGDYIVRTITQVDPLGRQTLLRSDRGDDGSFELITATSYGENTETRVVTNGGNVTTTTLTRDAFGNVVSLVTNGPGITQETFTIFSEDGTRPLQSTSSGGLVTNWSYNAAGFESRMETTRSGALIRQRVWEFDAAGSPISVLDREFIPGEVRIHRDATLVYEGANLISEVGLRFVDTTEYAQQLTATRSFEYDTAGRLLRESIETEAERWEATWTWTDDGPLESFRTQVGADFDERRFEYDAAGRLRLIDRETTDGYPLDETWTYDCL